jgi:EmrB/QacA subfamily drug resistance transporter
MASEDRHKWLALLVLCASQLMIVLDLTIVNVALPSIRDDLGFTEADLAWVVNAYLLSFGGFLLLGGRLGDLFGHRRLFLAGLVLFTVASLGCGLAESEWQLIVARAVQGLGGALVSAVGLSLIVMLFTEPAERAKAMGIAGAVISAGGTAGVLLGGVLTDLLSWHWIFFVNIPVGIAVIALAVWLVPSPPPVGATRLDAAGAITVTLSLVLIVYAVVNANQNGWMSAETLGVLGAGLAIGALFVLIESRSREPLMPLRIVRMRNVATADVVATLMAGGMFAAFFTSALYLQLVLGYSPLEVGLAYLPLTLISGAVSILLSHRLVMRYGVKPPMSVGLALMAAGLFLFARVPADGTYFDVLPAMVVLGLGNGIVLNPLLIGAMSDVAPSESGLASGLVNTAFMMGGALGLAVFASLGDWRTRALLADGQSTVDALTGGYHLAFICGGIACVLGLAIGLAFMRQPATVPQAAAAGG